MCKRTIPCFAFVIIALVGCVANNSTTVRDSSLKDDMTMVICKGFKDDKNPNLYVELETSWRGDGKIKCADGKVPIKCSKDETLNVDKLIKQGDITLEESTQRLYFTAQIGGGFITFAYNCTDSP